MSIYPPTGTLEIKDATLKIPVIDLQYTSNTAKIEANSNVVTEFQRSKKLIKYPRVALTSAAQTESGYEGYFVSQDSATLNGVSNRQAWALFDTQGPGQGTGLASPHFDASGARFDSSGNYTGGDSLGGISGDWVYIRLPDKIQLQSVALWARFGGLRNPIDATVLGSLNGTNWSVVGSWTGASFTSGKSTSFNLNSIQYYDYIGFVFEKIEANSSGGYVNFHEIELFGVPEYDPDADGVDVVVKSVPNVPNTDWLEVYYDAKDLVDGSITNVDDLTPNGTNDGTATNVTVSDGAFVFNGTSSLLESTTTITNSTGDIPHAFSLWVKPSDSDLDDTNNHYLIVYGTELNTGKWSGISISNKRFASVIHASVIRFGPEVRVGEWYHIVLNYKSGGIHNSERFDFFINGSQIDTTALSTAGSQAGSATLSLSSPAKLVLGGLFTGAERSSSTIANSRLFNRALTSDEIYQLYAYQREYFGHGDLSMTLKAGRLGIGTSEPRAALDVRGDVHISGSLRKTRARMIRLEAGAKHFTLDGWQTYVSYGETWTAYSSDPLYSVSITGDYVSVARAINYRIAVQNQRTDEVKYFPSSSGWVKYHYVDNTRLDGHGYLGIMSGLTLGDSYRVQLEVDPNSTNDYQWNTAYGTITGLVWD